MHQRFFFYHLKTTERGFINGEVPEFTSIWILKRGYCEKKKLLVFYQQAVVVCRQKKSSRILHWCSEQLGEQNFRILEHI